MEPEVKAINYWKITDDKFFIQFYGGECEVSEIGFKVFELDLGEGEYTREELIEELGKDIYELIISQDKEMGSLDIPHK